MQKTALITGITGQDGAYLANFLLEKDYIVHGMRPYAPLDDTANLTACLDHPNFHLHRADLADSSSLLHILKETQPTEIYNLGAMSHVGESFNTPEAAADINGLGTLRLLEAIRALDMIDRVRFYQASSSELFGNAPAPQSETTPFMPQSPYATAKLYAYHIVCNYRDAYGLHASNGILFNHESPLRGEEFVTRKISKAIASIVSGKQELLEIGNLNARRDWGHARDYVRGMWLMLRQDSPDDYVLATGQSFSVRDFIIEAFSSAKIALAFEGEGLDEIGRDLNTGRVLVRVNPAFYRPNEVSHLVGDATKALARFDWKPLIPFKAMVREMVHHDLAHYDIAPDTDTDTDTDKDKNGSNVVSLHTRK